MAGGAVTPAEIERQFRMLDVACSRCERADRYRVVGLIATYGRNMQLPHLREILAADCPRMRSVSIYD